MTRPRAQALPEVTRTWPDTNEAEAIKSPSQRPRPTHIARRGAALVVPLALLALVCACAHPRPWSHSGPRADARAGELDVASYNVLYLNHDLGRLVETIRTASPTVIGLCELTEPARAALEAGLSAAYPFRRYHGEFGLLSKVPLTAVEALPRAYARQGGLIADVRVGERLVRVAVVHLIVPELDDGTPAGAFRSLSAAERAHVRELEWLLHALEDGPAVVMGDFNSMPHQRTRAFMGRRGFTDAAGATRLWPGPTWRGPVFGTSASLRIDYIYARGLDPLDTRELQSPASDHALVQARLRLNAAGRPRQ